MSHLNFWILAFSTNLCPIKTDLSGNTVWPQASGFQKLVKMDHFWHLWLTFVHSKCKRSSLRSQWDIFCDFQTICHCGFTKLQIVIWIQLQYFQSFDLNFGVHFWSNFVLLHAGFQRPDHCYEYQRWRHLSSKTGSSWNASPIRLQKVAKYWMEGYVGFCHYQRQVRPSSGRIPFQITGFFVLGRKSFVESWSAIVLSTRSQLSKMARYRRKSVRRCRLGHP